VPETLDLESEVQALFKAKLREFAAFCREHFIIQESDKADWASELSDDQISGYNQAMTEGVDMALDCWCEENSF